MVVLVSTMPRVSATPPVPYSKENAGTLHTWRALEPRSLFLSKEMQEREEVKKSLGGSAKSAGHQQPGWHIYQ